MNYLSKLQSATTTEDFSHLLGFTPKGLTYILYHYKGNKYSTFQIPKKNGSFRTINSPCKELKDLQRRLSDYLYKCLDIIKEENKINNTVSFGYQKEKCIYDNAIVHKNRRYVFNVDLKDFFNSITFGRVRGYFIKNKYFKLDEHIATLIAQTACYNNMLPQGSPLSPIITILIGNILDINILRLTRKVHCSYSRYVDDLTFSTNLKDFPSEIAVKTTDDNWGISKTLKDIINRNHFEVNESKISMQYRNSRQKSVGLIVNKKIDIPREYYKNVRAMCNSLFTKNTFYIKDAKEDEPPTLNQLQGMLNYIFSIKSRNTFIKELPNKKTQYPRFQNLYIDFLLYRWFFANEMPIIFTEGKTDIVYLKCALKRLKDDYPKLINSDGTLNVQFIWINTYLQEVFHISSGTEGLLSLLNQYENFLKRIKPIISSNLVFFLLDHDDGASKIISHCKAVNKDTKVFFDNKVQFPQLSVKFIDTIYLLFTHKESGKSIESYFPQDILGTEIQGRFFNPNNNVHAGDSFYGKQVFATKVVKQNKKTIDFSI